MNSGKYLGYAILTFFIGFITVYIFAGLFGYSGGNGGITSSIFNSGIMALVGSILFLCVVLVVCTMMIVNTIKNKNN